MKQSSRFHGHGLITLAAHAAADDLHQLLDHGLALLLVDGIHHAAFDVVLEQE
jgi:hypothetical protein